MLTSLGISLLFCIASVTLQAQQFRELYSDTWVATDGLGRSLPAFEETGGPRANVTVGIFYFLWLRDQDGRGPYDIAKILAANPQNPAWGTRGAFHHWAEPEIGYYTSAEEWVYRRHAYQLGIAGVDVVILDASNSYTYPEAYLVLCRAFRAMRDEGFHTPKIAFLLNTNSVSTLRTLYTDFYSKGIYRELWFEWKGKPLVLSPTLDMPAEYLSFFTFRQSWAWTTPNSWFGDGRNKWPWLDYYPQKPGWSDSGTPEELPVGVAQHPTSNIGRSYQSGLQPASFNLRTDSGPYFAEQWNRAVEVRPEFVFVSGWNEWIAQRFVVGTDPDPKTFLGQPTRSGQTFFVDLYSQEFSRDIEPMKGGHSDNYYYQMINGIRRYKGVRPNPDGGPQASIKIDGDFWDWNQVDWEYRDAAYDTNPRNARGFGSLRYTNRTGRNDIVMSKVARDRKNLYFHVQTRDALTPATDPYWMLLYIDADQNHSTGWNGYDFIVNTSVQNGKTQIRRLHDDGQPGDEVGWGAIGFFGNQMELSIPAAMLGIDLTQPFTFDFHWADNIQQFGKLEEFFVNGDHAPDRRFNYRYHVDVAQRDEEEE